MAGALPALKLGPVSYQVSGLVTGGQLVIPTGCTGTAAPAAPSAQTVISCTTANAGASDPSGSRCVLGVAGNDANVLTMPGLPSANTYGDQQLDISQLPDYVSVYTIGEFYVNFENAVNFGAPVMAGAAGGVKAWNGTNADAVIGRCMQPGGVSAGSTIALVFFMII